MNPNSIWSEPVSAKDSSYHRISPKVFYDALVAMFFETTNFGCYCIALEWVSSKHYLLTTEF